MCLIDAMIVLICVLTDIFASKTFTMADILLVLSLIYFPSQKSISFNLLPVDIEFSHVSFMFVMSCHFAVDVCK